MSKPDLNINKKTIEKFFPELFGFVKGKWYRHITTGSVAYYKGTKSGINDTFGINPWKHSNPDDSVVKYHFGTGHWFGSADKLGLHWENVDIAHVINLFKKYFGFHGFYVGAQVHFMRCNYIISGDWYFDEDNLMMVCINEVGSKMHIPLIDKGEKGKGITLL